MKKRRTIYLFKKYIFELFCFQLLINLLLVNFFREVIYMKTVNRAINWFERMVGGSKRDGRVSEAAGRGWVGKLSRADVKATPIKYLQCCVHRSFYQSLFAMGKMRE